MKNLIAYPGLVEWINTHNNFQIAKCYTFTIPNLPPVVGSDKTFYWTSADLDVTYADIYGVEHTFLHPADQGTMPIIKHDSFTCARGLETTTLPLIMICGPEVKIPGYTQTIPALAMMGVFDGAEVLLEYAFMGPSGWGQHNIVGVVPMFQGLVSQVTPSSSTVGMVVSSECERLQTLKLPIHLFEASCQAFFGDAGCGVDLALHRDTWAVTGSNATRTSFNSSSSKSDGYYNSGYIEFTSGINKGVAIACRQSNQLSGKFLLANPLISPPQAGDTFTATRGCAKSKAACTSYNNLHRYRGFPDIPSPEAAL